MSDFYNKYPYTDFHELNLDWVIERVKKLTEDWLATQEAWNNTQEQWQQLYDYVHDYFDNLDVQDEINNKINQMILDGTFMTVVAPTINQTVVDATTTWLAEHITQPTTPAIDNTLTINGAAADARATGRGFADVYSASSTYNIGDYVLQNGLTWKCSTAIATPETWDSTHWTWIKTLNELKTNNNGSVMERIPTASNFTDFNDIIQNGCYLVNSALTNGYKGAGSETYSGELIAMRWRTGNTYGFTQIMIEQYGNAYYRFMWQGTFTAWIGIPHREMTYEEKGGTLNVYADFNLMKDNGCYLANSALTNGIYGAGSATYNGTLTVFSFNHSHTYGTIQMYVESTGDIYYRSLWNNVWTSWQKLALEADLQLLRNAFDKVTRSTNILDPSTFTRRGYYYDFTDGVTQITSTTAIISDPIDVPDIGWVYIRQDFSTSSTNLILVYCYDENDTYLGYFYTAFNVVQNDSFKLFISPNTKKIIIYSNSNTVTGDNICISLFEADKLYLYDEQLNNIVNKGTDNKLYKLNIANFGDSIFGIHRPPKDISTYIEQYTGSKVYNLGFGGCRMAQHQDSEWDAFSMYRLAYSVANNDFTVQDTAITDPDLPAYFAETLALLKSINFSEIDIVTIAYGTNDFTASVPLSNSDPYDTATFDGALRYSIETLLAAFPHLKIFICTPTWRYWMTGGVYTDDSDTRVIGGQKLTDFVSSCETIAHDYHFTAIDNYWQLGINKYNYSNYFPANDGTHHNYNGVELIARHIINDLF